MILLSWVECYGIGPSISGEVVNVLGVSGDFAVGISLKYNNSSS